jgi:hypothetical protein
MVRVTFGGSRSVTIPVGQEIWSDDVLRHVLEKSRSEKGLEGVAAISAGVPNASEIVSTAVQASAKSLPAACSEGQS